MRVLVLLCVVLGGCGGTTPVKQTPGPANRDPRPAPKPVDPDPPHDGSLDPSGTSHDMKNGKLDDAFAITNFMVGCKNAITDPKALPFCGCYADYLRVAPPSIIKVARDESDPATISEIPGVKRCMQWVTDGARDPNPFLRRGMKTSGEIEVLFLHCKTQMPEGQQPDPVGTEFCNRHLAKAR